LSPVRRPLPWIAIAFAFGIFLSNLASLTGPIAIIGLLAATVLSATVTAASKRPLWLLFTFLSLASTLGFLRFKSQEAVSTDDISFLAPAEVQLTGIVDSEAQQLYADSSAHTKRIRLTLNVTRATTKAD